MASCSSCDLTEIVRIEFLFLAAADKQHSLGLNAGRAIQHRQFKRLAAQFAGSDELLCHVVKWFLSAEYRGLGSVFFSFVDYWNHETIGLNIRGVLDY